ncbi:MAG: flagellar biosynthesis protein FlhF [Candidatus Hydrogenedentes bacterium]|nr:flagellar biosynthesis protein FlhF [Candidatus Hydrogenedentota bacterium]
MAQQFHRFRAASFDEAYQQMRQALGDQAVVLRTAQVTEGGLLGFLGRKRVEITASAPQPRPARLRTPRPQPSRPLSMAERKYAASSLGSDENVRDTVAYFQRLVSDAQQRMKQPEAARPTAAKAEPPAHEPAAPASAAEEPRLVPRQVRGGAPRPEQVGNTAVAPVIPFQPLPEPAVRALHRPEADVQQGVREIREMLEVLLTEAPGAGVPVEFQPYYKRFLDMGMTRRAAATLLSAATRDSDFDVIRNERVMRERLRTEIQRRVAVTGGVGLAAGTRRVVALVGATGVGKTTNLAKLAARFAVRERASVALITADTYRVAASEQLRVYANIIGLPMQVVDDGKDMAAALHEFRDHDLVLIDTAGGSQFNLKQTDELRTLLAAAQPDEVMLVVSGNTRLEDQRQVVAGFRTLEPSSLFFTKLDETRHYGPLYSLATEAGLPLSYLSVGQNVPDDVMLAKPDRIADLIMEGGTNRDRSSA